MGIESADFIGRLRGAPRHTLLLITLLCVAGAFGAVDYHLYTQQKPPVMSEHVVASSNYNKSLQPGIYFNPVQMSVSSSSLPTNNKGEYMIPINLTISEPKNHPSVITGGTFNISWSGSVIGEINFTLARNFKSGFTSVPTNLVIYGSDTIAIQVIRQLIEKGLALNYSGVLFASLVNGSQGYMFLTGSLSIPPFRFPQTPLQLSLLGLYVGQNKLVLRVQNTLPLTVNVSTLNGSLLLQGVDLGYVSSNMGGVSLQPNQSILQSIAFQPSTGGMQALLSSVEEEASSNVTLQGSLGYTVMGVEKRVQVAGALEWTPTQFFTASVGGLRFQGNGSIIDVPLEVKMSLGSGIFMDFEVNSMSFSVKLGGIYAGYGKVTSPFMMYYSNSSVVDANVELTHQGFTRLLYDSLNGYPDNITIYDMSYTITLNGASVSLSSQSSYTIPFTPPYTNIAASQVYTKIVVVQPGTQLEQFGYMNSTTIGAQGVPAVVNWIRAELFLQNGTYVGNVTIIPLSSQQSTPNFPFKLILNGTQGGLNQVSELLFGHPPVTVVLKQTEINLTVYSSTTIVNVSKPLHATIAPSKDISVILSYGVSWGVNVVNVSVVYPGNTLVQYSVVNVSIFAGPQVETEILNSTFYLDNGTTIIGVGYFVHNVTLGPSGGSFPVKAYVRFTSPTTEAWLFSQINSYGSVKLKVIDASSYAFIYNTTAFIYLPNISVVASSPTPTVYIVSSNLTFVNPANNYANGTSLVTVYNPLPFDLNLTPTMNFTYDGEMINGVSQWLLLYDANTSQLVGYSYVQIPISLKAESNTTFTAKLVITNLTDIEHSASANGGKLYLRLVNVHASVSLYRTVFEIVYNYPKTVVSRIVSLPVSVPIGLQADSVKGDIEVVGRE